MVHSAFRSNEPASLSMRWMQIAIELADCYHGRFREGPKDGSRLCSLFFSIVRSGDDDDFNGGIDVL